MTKETQRARQTLAGGQLPTFGKPSFGTKLAFGFGSAAFGVKDSGFSYFLLLFYGTVVGLEPGLVGLAILLALVLDAVSDPLVGYWSDNFRSRWGRRHPFMYASALPVSFSFFLLWNPPDWSQGGLFVYLLCISVLIRTFITFYETPSYALLPELTTNYEERTSIQLFRTFFAWVGGNLLTVLMFGVLLVPTEQYSDGILNHEAYATFGILGSCLMFVAIMISSLGTHHRIPGLRQPGPPKRKTVRQVFGEISETLRDRNFLMLFWAFVMNSIAAGIAASLAFIMLSYFWEFTEFQRFIWTASVFVSALGALLLAPRLVRRFGKRQTVLSLGIIAFSIAPMPVVLRLLGLLPENGDPLLFPLITIINTVDLAMIIALQGTMYSMIADLAESGELRTGRRTEGVYYAAVTFTRKTTAGLGVFAGGMMLSAISFPDGATPGSVDAETIWWLGALYAPSLLVLWATMLFAVSRFTIDRDRHQANVRALAAGNDKRAR